MKHFTSFLFFVAAAGIGHATPVFSISGCVNPTTQSNTPISVGYAGCFGTGGTASAAIDFTNMSVASFAPITSIGGHLSSVSATLDFEITMTGGIGTGVLEGFLQVSSFQTQGMPCGLTTSCRASSNMTFGRVGQIISVSSTVPHPPVVPFQFSFVFGVPQGFRWNASASAENNPAGNGPQSTFLNASLGPFTVLDSAGNVVSGASVTGSNGFVYPTSGAVPEPASFLLMGAALVALGVVRRRK